MCNYKNIAANNLYLGAVVLEQQQTLWGWVAQGEVVTTLYCDVEAHMVVAKLTIGQVLQHIRLYSTNTLVKLIQGA